MHTPHARSRHLRRQPLTAVVACIALAAALLGARSSDSPMLTECKTAMSTMMRAMHFRTHGDDDADFAALMIAHHQGAIEMAKAELRHGRNEQLRRLAQEMIITQQQEIVAMRMAAGGSSLRDSSTLTPRGGQR